MPNYQMQTQAAMEPARSFGWWLVLICLAGLF
jgi:hypothetical protein